MAEPEKSKSVETQAGKRSKPKRPLPTDRIRFDNQLAILRGYASAYEHDKKPVGNRQVAALVEMNEGTTTLINGFLVDVGLVQRVEGGFIPSADLMAFYAAWKWEPDKKLPEKAGVKLQPTMRASWFYRALAQRLQLRAMDESQAIATLAEASGADPNYRAQLRLLLDYLSFTGLIINENGHIRPAPETGAVEVRAEGDAEESTGSAEQRVRQTHEPSPRLGGGAINFSVDLQIDTEEIGSWPPERIAAFFSGLAKVIAAKGGLETPD